MNRRHHVAFAAAGLILLPVATWQATNQLPPWVTMWALAGSEFFALKLFTLVAEAAPATFRRKLAYLLLWPGMDAKAFLLDRTDRQPEARLGELGLALLKMAGGLVACGWTARQVGTSPPLLVAWIGMVGLIFTLHFGLLHMVSWGWRRVGVDAPPIMRSPITADSLSDFWGGRWNKAFADAARRFLFRPTVRLLGASGAGAFVFLVSGLIHETVTSLPAQGGWGGPTLYFLLQGAGIAVEKSALGKKLSLGAGLRGWLWTILCTAAPLPFLFHLPFVHRVIVPFFQTLNHLLP